MTCRLIALGEEAAGTMVGLKGAIEVIECDLAEPVSVRHFVEALLAKHDRRDGLMCKAGKVSA